MNLSEFECSCRSCAGISISPALVDLLSVIEQRYDRDVIITSGHRCHAHNASVGGSRRSKHTEGIAADIVVPGIPPDHLYAWLCDDYPTKYGFGIYNTHVHVDVRTRPARWDNRT